MADVQWAEQSRVEIATHTETLGTSSAMEIRSVEQLSSDLEQSQVALQSLLRTKSKLLESLEELEESEARMKQVIEIQQARLRQLGWRNRDSAVEGKK
jgi:predicted Zn-ribbon and HTH transcriptional regulator